MSGSTRLVLLANSAMRARQRPFAIALMYAFEVALALAVTWPIARFVSASYGSHPQGDAPLWQPGGLSLLDLLVRSENVLPALSAHVAMVIAIGIVLGLFPLAALIVSIAYTTPQRRSPPFRRVLSCAAATMPSLTLLLLVMAVVQGLVALGGVLATGAVASSCTSSMGEARAQQLGGIVAAVFVLVVAMAGVVHDLARTAAVRFEIGPFAALRIALRTWQRGPFRVTWSWCWRVIVAWLPIMMGAFVAHRLGGRGGGPLFAVLAVHQLVILSRVALRASWLAKALRMVDARESPAKA